MIVLTPRPGRPSDDDFETLERVESARVAELDLVRTRAEKWLGAITGLTGLLSVVLVIKTPTEITKYPTTTKTWVAVLLGVALLLLCSATVSAYSAAFGRVGELQQIDTSRVTGVHERYLTKRQQIASRAQRRIRWAVAMTFVAVLLVAIATGITWFAPQTPSEATVETIRVVIDD